MSDQARIIFGHLSRLLDDLGAVFDQVAKLSIYTTDMSRWQEVDAERRRWFTGSWPAVTSLEVNRFANPDALLEVEAVMHLPPQATGSADGPGHTKAGETEP